MTPDARFEIGRCLGQSGPYVTWWADDRKLGRAVAVKTFRHGQPLDRESVERFLSAAALCGSLCHPGIVPVFDSGVFADGRPYVVMPVVEGMTLAEAIEEHLRERPTSHRVVMTDPTTRKLLQRFVEVCRALDHAHSQGVGHRDVRPANVLLRPAGAVVVGWSRARRIAGFPEEPGQAWGEPAYQSPEQARGENFGGRSDVYSLGATLYEILAGKPPRIRTDAEVRAAAIDGEIVPLEMAVAGVPGDLAAVCDKALAGDPALRYQTAGQLGDEVERCLADAPVKARPEPTIAGWRRWVKRHRAVTTINVVAVLLFLAATVLGAWLYDYQETVAAREADLRAQWQEADLRAQWQQELAEAYRGRARLEVAETHNEAGKALLEAGQHDGAREQFESACEVYAGLLKTGGLDEGWLAETHNNLGDLERQIGNAEAATRSYHAARQLLEGQPMRRVWLESERAGFRRLRRCSYASELVRTYEGLSELEKDAARRGDWRAKRAEALIRASRYRLAAESVPQLAEEPLTGERQYGLACALARGAEGVFSDEDMPLPQREKISKDWCRLAVELLHRAQRQGHFADKDRRDWLKDDPDLDPLRKRDDFQRWLAGL